MNESCGRTRRRHGRHVRARQAARDELVVARERVEAYKERSQ